jgi:hypothetical protein
VNPAAFFHLHALRRPATTATGKDEVMQDKMPSDQFVFSMREVASILGVSVSAVKCYVFRGQLHVHRIGRRCWSRSPKSNG